jgi:hypothetical protein
MTKTLLSRIVRAGLIMACFLLSISLMAQNAPTSCSNATLQGTYTFLTEGSIIGAHGALVPFQQAGLEVFDGNGNSHGFFTTITVVNGQTTVSSQVPFTATYSISASCTVKESGADANNNAFHFDGFLGPNGNHMTLCLTDPGIINCGSENRDSGK